MKIMKKQATNRVSTNSQYIHTGREIAESLSRLKIDWWLKWWARPAEPDCVQSQKKQGRLETGQECIQQEQMTLYLHSCSKGRNI
jgi:hypothetical protein